jgi:hypothetical protein
MITTLLASAVIVFAVPEPEKLDIERMLDAIRGAENWDGKSTGHAGEYGPYQMTPEVWRKSRMGWKKDIREATPDEWRAAALEDLRFRIVSLEINHFRVTPFLAALAWTAGVRAVITHTASRAKADYATRAERLYAETSKQKAEKR